MLATLLIVHHCVVDIGALFVCCICNSKDMQVLRISVAVVLLLNVSLSSAQQADQIVSKVFPADIVCRRNSAQRDVERQESISLGGSETLLVVYCIASTIPTYITLTTMYCAINTNHFVL